MRVFIVPMFAFFRRRKLRAKAKRLVDVSQIVCTSLTSGLVDRLPVVDGFLHRHADSGLTRLDICLTVASVGVGMMTADVDKRDSIDFLVEVMRALHEWRPAAPILLADFQERALQVPCSPEESILPIGFWILTQLGLDDSEAITRQDASVFGGLVLKSMAAWD